MYFIKWVAKSDKKTFAKLLYLSILVMQILPDFQTLFKSIKSNKCINYNIQLWKCKQFKFLFWDHEL